MDYPSLLADVGFYIAGCLTIVMLFYKKIFKEVVPINFFGKKNIAEDKAATEFYALLSSNVDLAIYKKSVDAIELERQRIATDIHDELASHLSSLYIDLELVNRQSDTLSVESARILYDMRSKIKYAIVAIRKIIYGMLPAALDNENLISAVKELCYKNDGHKGSKILFRSSGNPVDLSDQQKLYLYRIIQELINNCLKHGLAWDIYVSLLWEGGKLKVTVRDNGIELPDFIRRTNRYGITGIFIRSMILGATARFGTRPHGGTEFELILPLTNDMSEENSITKVVEREDLDKN